MRASGGVVAGPGEPWPRSAGGAGAPHWLTAGTVRAASSPGATPRGGQGGRPCDSEPARPIGELSVRSEEFGTVRGGRDVRVVRAGVRRFRRPVVGEPERGREGMGVPEGFGAVVCGAPADGAAADALTLLAGWVALGPAGGGAGVW
ncbi:hypothetical protein [Kitasatospora sp. NPDC059673]|uniref:MmyB family transcriptional regulator n=1 Tax=Kitasatospora sp. NPDC059673 TaxID=3346901 RepID=UPI0036796B18